jgi:glycosyltransferase involved in cell wall biosynthesis
MRTAESAHSLGKLQSGAVSERTAWPRVSLVTPVLNCARYIEQTIRSVISQGYPNLEYIVVDGGSTDGTLEIIQKYEQHMAWWMSEPDRGMYDALNKGFARTSGEVMGWICATDQLHIGGLRVVGSVFKAFAEVEWITGLPTWFDEHGMTICVGPIPHWSRFRFLAGANRCIQQESTYWRRTLWERAGGYVDASRRIASDFELWVRFFRHARLHPVNALIGGYRDHLDPRSSVHSDCHRIHDEVIAAELKSMRWGGALKVFGALDAKVARIPKVRGVWRRLVTDPLYRRLGADWPPVIQYHQGEGWVMRS